MTRIITVDSRTPDLLAGLESVWASGAAAFLSPDGGAPRWNTAPHGTAVIARTSGSSGPARGVAISHAALESAVTSSLDRLGGQVGDRWALALPAHHVSGLLVLLRARASRTTAVRIDRIERRGPLATEDLEHIAVVPTQLVRALRAGVDLTRFRTVLVGGGPLDEATRRSAQDRGVRLVESYGATETCGGCVYDGVPLDGTRIRIGSSDEVLIRGPSLASGYLDDPKATAERFRDGWFETRDAGRIEDGRLIVLGRLDDVAVSGGVNVPLEAVAEALRTADGVLDAIAIGVPDPEWGRSVRAVVVPTDGSRPSLQHLRDHVARFLPRTHAPREVLYVTSIGRGRLGKVSSEVRAALVEEPPAERLE